MSNFLEKLLDGAGVEWKPIWEVTIWDKRFNAVDNYKQKKIAKYHYFLAKEFQPLVKVGGNVKLLTTNISDQFTTEDLAGDKLSEGEIVAIPWGGNPVVQYHNGKFLTSDNRIATSIDTNYLNNKYLYYFLLNNLQLIETFYRGSGIKHPSMASILDLMIPIPPIEIQREIVRILDAFTELTTELTTELKARKKQYNHYRDQLLTFSDDEVEWKTLDDIVSFRRGSFPQPYGDSNWYDGEGSMPFVQVADVSDCGFTLNRLTKQRISRLAQPKSVFVKGGTVIVTLQGTIGRVAITPYDSYVDRTLAIFTNYKVDINKKYFAYQLKNKFDIEKEYARGSTLKTITKEEFSSFEIPVPTLKEQARIVAILDKFDILANSITEGLPREIALRQKQYEYYRDLLLNFPKPIEAVA